MTVSTHLLTLRNVATSAVLSLSTLAACGGSGGSGAVCDVDFANLAGTYSFTWTEHRVRYSNSCFDAYYDTPTPESMTNCTWQEEPRDDTFKVEIVITEDGNVGSAKFVPVEGDIGNEISQMKLDCELLEGKVCEAPVRCHFSDGGNSSYTPDPTEWMWSCGCETGGTYDPAGAACQACKAQYEQYISEQASYRTKGDAASYFEFTLSVK
jgi:hypothetical protein